MEWGKIILFTIRNKVCFPKKYIKERLNHILREWISMLYNILFIGFIML